MTVPELSGRWRKSSFSSQDGDCVEMAPTLDAVRDSKDPGAVLTVDVRMLVSMIRSGQPDR